MYVDGFNLFNRRLKNTPYKWLDLEKLFQSFNFQNVTNLVKIRYFTARLSGAIDPDLPRRQNVYLRALGTLPNLEIHYGHFKLRQMKGRLYNSATKQAHGKVVDFEKFEEKGSDVNIASYMISDAYEDLFDTAVLISNDSDLAAPLEIVNSKLKKAVALVSPDKFHMTELKRHSSIQRTIYDTNLIASQFPTQIKTPNRVISKPSAWP